MIDPYSISSLKVLLLMTLMFVKAKSLCLNDCMIDCDFSACNGNNSCEFIYSNFSDALIHLDMLCNSSVKIFLMGGEYFMEQYEIKVSKNITIQGQTNTTINCGDITDDQTSTSLLHFYNHTTVELSNLQFNNCRRPLRFDNISKLIVSQCIFRHFSNGAVVVLNAKSFNISNSTFQNGSTPGDDASIAFRADSGGLALNYFQNNISDFTAYIYNCSFINGTAGEYLNIKTIRETYLPERLYSGLNQNRFTGRGGGMGIYINADNTSVNVTVRNCSFKNNYANLYGGGLYLITRGNNSNHSLLVEDTFFINNSVAAAGGAIEMAFVVQNLNVSASQFNYTNCTFISNSANYGGAVSAIQTYMFGRGNIVNMKKCNFAENYSTKKGSAITFASLLYPENSGNSYSYSITDCNFTDNSDPGGVVNLGFNTVEFYGLNKFEKNSGPSLRVVGSLIKIFGKMVFKNNSATNNYYAGTVYISEFGQLQVTDGATIDFSENKAIIGAGFSVDLEASPVPYANLIGNTECFITHSNSSLPPNDWENINISFSDNVATIGVAVFATTLDHCSWRQGSTFDLTAVVNSSSFNYNLNTNTGLSKNAPSTMATNEQYYIQTRASRVTFNGSKEQSLSARPGQTFKLYIEPTDEFGFTTIAILRFIDEKYNTNPQSSKPSSIITSGNQSDVKPFDLIQLIPTIYPFIGANAYINLTFGLPYFPTQFVEPSIIQDARMLIEMPFNPKKVEIAHFNLTILPCQAGFVLTNQSNGLVQCDCSYVDSIWFGSQIISCDKDTQKLRLIDGFWSISVKRDRYHLQSYPCPVPYCMCLNTTEQSCINYFNHSNSNAQCHLSRKGFLCGSCVNNSGVGVLSLTCFENCHTYIGVTSIIFLVLWNGILAILFLRLSYKFPPELKGILFYIQTVPYATEYFPISVWKHKQYMLYISSFISFYFPADFCLFPNVDALTVYAVGYIPLVVIIATQLIFVRILITFNRSRRFLRKSAVWNGLWTWIFLVYSRYIYSSLNVLNCISIGNEGIRWFRDGTVKCFKTPGHVVLALLAIIVLTIGLALIPLILLLVYKKIKIRHAVLYLYEPLTHGYKISVKWWTAVDLLRRVIIIFVIVGLPGRTSIPAGILFLVFLMHVYFQPYQIRWHNWLETYILLHFVVMLLLRSTRGLLEQLTDYSGIMVPVAEQDLNNTKSITALPESDKATIFFLIWIYTPVSIVMVYLLYCLIAYFIPKIKGWYKMSQTRKENANFDTTLLHSYVEMKEEPTKLCTVSYA